MSFYFVYKQVYLVTRYTSFYFVYKQVYLVTGYTSLYFVYKQVGVPGVYKTNKMIIYIYLH